jgi:hypothetical protein
MLDSTPPPTVVKIVFDPYNYLEVNHYLRSVAQDFGPAKRGRWYFETEPYIEGNTWALKFFFSDPTDATLFGLKYLR